MPVLIIVNVNGVPQSIDMKRAPVEVVKSQFPMMISKIFLEE
jgi:hypothetical protein